MAVRMLGFVLRVIVMLAAVTAVTMLVFVLTVLVVTVLVVVLDMPTVIVLDGFHRDCGGSAG